MGDSYGAEPSVWSSADQGALGQPTPRLAIVHALADTATGVVTFMSFAPPSRRCF